MLEVMPVSFAVLLGVVQALTEFLPVSSSGHLVVFQLYLREYFSAPETPLTFDVLVHVATLLVSAVYLRKDIILILSNGFKKADRGSEARGLVYAVILGTVPAAVIGLGFHDQVEASFSSTAAAANGFLVTAVVLELAHRLSRRAEGNTPQEVTSLFGWTVPTLAQAFLIGLAQAVAVFPGVSRSGATIGAALMLGLSANTAVRFSFLLLLPAVGGAALLESRNIAALSESQLQAYGAGFLTTLCVGWFALIWLVRIVERSKLRWFAAYTLLLSLFLRFGSVHGG